MSPTGPDTPSSDGIPRPPDQASPGPKSRDTQADLVKALAILGVVYIHASRVVYSRSPSVETVSDAFRFGVPCFIILWAYFFEKSLLGKPRDVGNVIKTRLARLFIPYAFWTFLYFVLIASSGSSVSPRKLLTGYWSGYGWAGQYFFIILFQLTPLFPLLRKVRLSRAGLFAMLGLSSVLLFGTYYYLYRINVVAKVGLRLFIYWIPYVLLGVDAARNGFRLVGSRALPLAILAVALIPVESSWIRSQRPVYDSYLMPSVLLASCLLVSSSMNGAGASLGRTRLVRYLGANTMGIFLINPLCVTAFGPLADRLTRPLYQPVLSDVVGPVLSVVVVTAGSLGLIWLFRACRLGILIGDS